MDGELKAILIMIVFFVVGACSIQLFYPGGVTALLGVWGK